VLLCIAGTVLNPDFATFDNAMNVLTRTAFIGIIEGMVCDYLRVDPRWGQ
jgi:ribose transport system permease protein